MKENNDVNAEPEPEPESGLESDLEYESEPERKQELKYHKWSSKGLAKAFKNANPKAINYVYQVFGKQLISMLCLKGCSVFYANDILQETMITLFEKLEKGHYKERGQLKSYFLRIGLNTYHGEIKKRKRQTQFHNDYTLEMERIEVDSEHHEALYQEKQEQALDIVQQLTISQEQVFFSRINNVPYKELATEMKTTEGALKMKYQRIKRKIERLKI